MDKIIEEKIYIERIKLCFGCIHNCGSQKDHDYCIDIESYKFDYIKSKVLGELLSLGQISPLEYHYYFDFMKYKDIYGIEVNNNDNQQNNYNNIL
jgi:hypothetical protein